MAQVIDDYFAYQNKDNGQYYYYNNKTKECTYEFPSKAFIFNPTTHERLYIPPGMWLPDYEPGTKIIGRNSKFPPRKKSKSIIEVPDFVINFRNKKYMYAGGTRSNFVDSSSQRFNREEFLKSIEAFQVPEYTKKFFKVRKGFHIFKSIPPETMVHFRTKPISTPLLKSLPSSLSKIAIQCFKYVMGYMEQIQVAEKTAADCANELIREMYNNPSLRDEVYVYLICQTSEVPDEDLSVRGWKLFLIVASIFPSSRDLEVWIMSHISKTVSTSPFDNVCDLAQFTYIRFESRCSLNTVLPIPADKNLLDIAEEVTTTTAQFGVSLLEIMWQQRELYPNLPIPYFLYYITKLIVSKGGYNYEGLFRISGNAKNISQLMVSANENLESIQDANIHDLTSLFKRWIRELPISLIPENNLSLFLVAVEEGKCDEFIKTLPKTSYETFAYLIGFLQECATQEYATQMGAGNLAIVFGPNIYSTSETSPEKLQEYNRICTESLRWLIENFDASKHYPVAL